MKQAETEIGQKWRNYENCDFFSIPAVIGVKLAVAMRQMLVRYEKESVLQISLKMQSNVLLMGKFCHLFVSGW